MSKRGSGLATTWTPSEKQRRFVDGLMLGLGITEAAKDAGCSRNTFYTRWRDDPDFRNYIETRRAGEALSKLPAVDRAVFEKARQGDIAACKLVYEVFGELRLRSLQLVNNQVNISSGDQYDFSSWTSEQLKKELAWMEGKMMEIELVKRGSSLAKPLTANDRIVDVDTPGS